MSNPFSSGPLGTIRLQLTTMEQSAKVLALLDFLQAFAAMTKQSRSQYWAMGDWHSLGPKLPSPGGGVARMLNEVEWKAEFEQESAIVANLHFQRAVTRLVLSPTNQLWGPTTGYRSAPRKDGLRLTFDSRSEWVKKSGTEIFPSLLDVLIYRGIHRTADDAQQMFELIVAGTQLLDSRLIQFGCCDFNTRSDNIVIRSFEENKIAAQFGEKVEDFHAILILKASLYEKVKAVVPIEYIARQKELSSGLGILLFTEVVSSLENRRELKRILSTID